MIDLVWANGPMLALGASSEAATDLPPLADHEPIITTISWDLSQHPRSHPPIRWDTLDVQIFQEVIQREREHIDMILPTILPLHSPHQIDTLATAISQALANALEASVKRAYPRPSGHRWWNQDCATTIRNLRRTARGPTSTLEEIDDARRTFRRVVRRARIDGFSEPQDVFKAVKWNRTEGSLPISPLQEGDTLHTSSDSKASYLVRALLQKASLSEDVSYDLDLPYTPRLPCPTISGWETFNAIAKAKSSTPGSDNITTAALKMAWPSLGQTITTLYNSCLESGWHPTPFRDATLVAIPSPGNETEAPHELTD